jgi:hypothetical protein
MPSKSIDPKTITPKLYWSKAEATPTNQPRLPLGAASAKADATRTPTTKPKLIVGYANDRTSNTEIVGFLEVGNRWRSRAER